MDFSNDRIYLYGLNVERQGENRPPYTFFADVVIIDKTYAGPFPSVYQLKDLLESPNDFQEPHPLAMVGEVHSILRRAKRILLVDGNMVCYNHLIIVNAGRHNLPHSILQNDKEFSSGLQALLEALRLRRRVSFDWTVSHRYRPEAPQRTALEKGELHLGKRKALHRMVGACARSHIQSDGQELTLARSDWSSHEKRLYEIIL